MFGILQVLLGVFGNFRGFLGGAARILGWFAWLRLGWRVQGLGGRLLGHELCGFGGRECIRCRIRTSKDCYIRILLAFGGVCRKFASLNLYGGWCWNIY